MSKINITFLTDQTEYTGDGEADIEYKAGKNYPMEPGSAQHWLSRNVAVNTDEAKENLKAEKAEAEKAEAEKAPTENKGKKGNK